MECTYHRFIHGEVMTHRDFSRNSGSSRAIPVAKIIDQVLNNPAIPIIFPREQPGMSGGNEVNMAFEAKQHWAGTGVQVAEAAMNLADLKVHKSVINRMLEPWMWHTAVITSTRWQNFFDQRISEHSQPEINDLAKKMEEALRASVPQRIDFDGWHLPYVTAEELSPVRSDLTDTARRAISVARVAGVSYNRLGTIREFDKDYALYQRLLTADPPHWSPFEHVASPTYNMTKSPPKGNFDGWHQLRHMLQQLPLGKNL